MNEILPESLAQVKGYACVNLWIRGAAHNASETALIVVFAKQQGARVFVAFMAKKEAKRPACVLTMVQRLGQSLRVEPPFH